MDAWGNDWIFIFECSFNRVTVWMVIILKYGLYHISLTWAKLGYLGHLDCAWWTVKSALAQNLKLDFYQTNSRVSNYLRSIFISPLASLWFTTSCWEKYIFAFKNLHVFDMWFTGAPRGNPCRHRGNMPRAQLSRLGLAHLEVLQTPDPPCHPSLRCHILLVYVIQWQKSLSCLS